MTRFLLTAMPFTGHVRPMLAVAAELVHRGHDVRVYTGSAFGAEVDRIGARFVPWRRAPDFDERDLAATFPRLVGRRGVAQVLVTMQDLFLGTASRQVADLDAEWAREPWDVHVAEESSIGPRLFTERRGCRWATVSVLPLALPSRQGPPVGLGLAPRAGLRGRARDAALRAVVPLLGRPLQRTVARERAAVGLPPSSQPFAEAALSPELVLASGVPALEHGRTDRPEHVRWVGALCRASGTPPALPEWWGDLAGRRVVVVTQGTQNLDPEDLIRPALGALAGVDALVVVSTGVTGRDSLPFPVPDNVRVAGFLPFEALLPRTAVLVTNGGWGGTLTALAHGVPLVVAGGDLDEPEVAARVASSGAGVDLRTGRPTPSAIRAAYERVSREASFADAAARIAADLAAAGGAPRAAELLEEFAAR